MRCSKFTTPRPNTRRSSGGSWPFSRWRGVMMYSTTSPSKSVGSGFSGRGTVGANDAAAPALMGAPAGADEEEHAALEEDDDRQTVLRRGWRGHRGRGCQLRLGLGWTQSSIVLMIHACVHCGPCHPIARIKGLIRSGIRAIAPVHMHLHVPLHNGRRQHQHDQGRRQHVQEPGPARLPRHDRACRSMMGTAFV